MPDIKLEIGALTDLLATYESILKAGKEVQKLDKDGKPVKKVDDQTLADAVVAMKEATKMSKRLCQQGVLGVKVSL